jgi:hypothetical protein
MIGPLFPTRSNILTIRATCALALQISPGRIYREALRSQHIRIIWPYGADKAPSIAAMPSVVALSDADLIKVVQDGTPAGMPSVSQLGDANIRAVVDFLCMLQGKTPTNAAAKVATGLRCGQEDQRARAAHRGRYARRPLGGGRPFGRQSGPGGTALVQDPAQTLDRAAHFPVVGWSQRLSKNYDYELPHASTETMICVAFLHLLPRRQCSFLTRS